MRAGDLGDDGQNLDAFAFAFAFAFRASVPSMIFNSQCMYMGRLLLNGGIVKRRGGTGEIPSSVLSRPRVAQLLSCTKEYGESEFAPST